jgi:hypothetical protein
MYLIFIEKSMRIHFWKLFIYIDLILNIINNINDTI